MIKKIFSVFLLSIASLSTEGYAAKGLVIKLDVTDVAENLISQKIRHVAGMKQSKRRHHVTIGYIEANIPDDTMDLLGQKIISILQQKINFSKNNYIKFNIDRVGQPFRNNITFIPSLDSEKSLKDLNLIVNQVVESLGYQCNKLTQAGNYVPHMTLSSNPKDAQLLDNLNFAVTSFKTSPDLHPLLQSMNTKFTMNPQTALPEGWVLADAVQEKRLPTNPLRIMQNHAGEVEIQGDNYTFSHDIPALANFDKETFALSLNLKSSVPGAYIQYWDGGKKAVNSAPHTGSGNWEPLKVEFTVDAKAKFFRFYSAILGTTNSNNPSVAIKDIQLQLRPESSILKHLNVEFIMNPNTSLPEGWVLADALQEKRLPTNPLRIMQDHAGEVEIRGDGYTLYHDIPALANFDKETFILSLDLKSTVPGAYIQYWDGGKVAIDSAPYTGSGNWEPLKIEFTVDAKAKFFRFYSIILGATKRNNPSVEVKNLKLQIKKLEESALFFKLFILSHTVMQ